MKIKHALQEYLLEIEVRKYTQKTIRSYRNNLNLFTYLLTCKCISRVAKLISDTLLHGGGALEIHVFLTVCYIHVVQIRYHKFLNYLIATAILCFQ